MSDMSAVIVPKSDQINADDLIGGPRTVRIAGVKVSPGTEQPVSISIEGDGKVYRPCKSMARVMVAAWGADSSAYRGRLMTLFRDPKVKWGGMEVGGIRIGAMSHIDGPMTLALTETRASRKPFTVKPLRTPATGEEAPATTADAKTGEVAAPVMEAKTTLSKDEWAERYMVAARAAPDRDALAELQSQRAAGLAKLAGSRPELHQRCIAAGLARLAELDGPDDDQPIDDDFPGDMPADEGVGA
jgi:hypothetical protein